MIHAIKRIECIEQNADSLLHCILLLYCSTILNTILHENFILQDLVIQFRLDGIASIDIAIS